MYYLQSRYYDPEVGRFINADIQGTSKHLALGSNLFAYCYNNPLVFKDIKGNDAVWIQEAGSAYGAGHTGLLVQDETGAWWYFFWGPDNEGISLGIVTGCNLNYVYHEINYNGFDLTTIEGVKSAIDSTAFKKPDDNRSANITGIIYLSGDYSNTHSYLLGKNDNYFDEQYNLLNNNCLQNSILALSKSSDAFNYLRIKNNGNTLTEIIPNLAYLSVLFLRHFRSI